MRLIDKSEMKVFKCIVIASDGSLCFYQKSETSLNGQFVSFQKQDDKNFFLNQKKHKKTIDSKHSVYYKKRYLKG